MRRIIAQLLIITVLAINVAWAADSCFSSPTGDTAVLAQIDAGQSSGACDDLCVGWLHLQFITPETGHTDFVPVHQTVAWTEMVFDSRDQEPPLRPPQI